jgi:CheY-like chemotaxis protein
MELKKDKINVLIIDDDSFNIHLVSALMKKIANVEITATDDGKEALAILESGDKIIDVVLLDLHMPKMDGRDILIAIREQNKYDNIPVVIISSVDGLERNELLNLGANDLVLKPFDVNMFVSVLLNQLS